jgi:hypothetical protein
LLSRDLERGHAERRASRDLRKAIACSTVQQTEFLSKTPPVKKSDRVNAGRAIKNHWRQHGLHGNKRKLLLLGER